MPTYDVIVIGRGLIGSAAARHLAINGARVAVIGPGEPVSHKSHTGVFGSHYDSGRIVRILDPFPYFSQIAKAAIPRFRPLEAQTGIRFYHEVGYLVVSNNGDYLRDMRASGERFYPQVEEVGADGLASRFPYFAFPADVSALYQATDGGYLNPRQHVAAQNRGLEIAGGVVVDDVVVDITQGPSEVIVRTATEQFTAAKVVLATGAFANVGGIIPRPIELGVVAHTTVLGEVRADQLDELAGMPSLSMRLGQDLLRFIYFMPPILYPDGKHYIKIGHSKGDLIPHDKASLTKWFQGDGDPVRIEWLTETLHSLLPAVTFESMHSRSCVTTRSPSNRQFIDQFEDPRIYSLLADHGQCGKSADELGHIMANFVLNGRVPEPYAAEDYALRFAEKAEANI